MTLESRVFRIFLVSTQACIYYGVGAELLRTIAVSSTLVDISGNSVSKRDLELSSTLISVQGNLISARQLGGSYL